MSNPTDCYDSLRLFECAMSTIASINGFPYAMALEASSTHEDSCKHRTDMS